MVLLQRADVTDAEMRPWRCCSQWGRRGFKAPEPGGIHTSKTGDTAIKGEAEPKRGRSNQQAYSQTCYGDAVAQHLPPLASARSMRRRARAEYIKPSVHVDSSQQRRGEASEAGALSPNARLLAWPGRF